MQEPANFGGSRVSKKLRPARAFFDFSLQRIETRNVPHELIPTKNLYTMGVNFDLSKYFGGKGVVPMSAMLIGVAARGCL